MSAAEPDELLVYDQPEPCPYLPARLARMPLRWPCQRLTGRQLDQRLADGDRRSGSYLYRTSCPSCRACEPIRLDVERFRPSATQRRILRRGDRLLTLDLGPPRVDLQRVNLFNTHRRLRGLTNGQADLDEQDYAAFLIDSCCETLEISYYLDQQLVAVAVADRGEQALSAVYCYFDPAHKQLSLGVYSVLKQLELCRQWGRRLLYLGYYIAESPHMDYKGAYLPHQRLIDGQWHWFETSNP